MHPAFVRWRLEKFPAPAGALYFGRWMKRSPKLTKRERKALSPARPAQAGGGGGHQHQHIHCIACGKHLDESQFEPPATATILTCDHGSNFPSCVRCATQSQALIAEHDRTNPPVKTAPAFH